MTSVLGVERWTIKRKNFTYLYFLSGPKTGQASDETSNNKTIVNAGSWPDHSG